MARHYASARDDILTAAQRVVASEGARGLTIESVAREAGLSRGGVLYHFESKEALIQGMINCLMSDFQADIDEIASADTDSRGRSARAYSGATIRLDRGEPRGRPRSTVALLAALAYDPSLLDPLRSRLAAWRQMTESDLDPVSAAIVRLASDGLWLTELFGFETLDHDLKASVCRRLDELTKE